MHMYSTSYGSSTIYRHKRGDIHALAKLHLPREEVEIVLADYPVNADSLQGLFNREVPDGKRLRRWRLTPRGGLREVPVDPAQEVAFVPSRKPKPEPTLAPADTPDAATFWATVTAQQKRK